MSSFWPEEAELATIPDDEPSREAEYLTELRRLTVLFDRCMCDEEISAAKRTRVINRFLHGSPTPEEPGDWALADAAPGVRTRPTWDVPPANG